jgi:tetratricopeptide (TPR) repeat protein
MCPKYQTALLDSRRYHTLQALLRCINRRPVITLDFVMGVLTVRLVVVLSLLLIGTVSAQQSGSAVGTPTPRPSSTASDLAQTYWERIGNEDRKGDYQAEIDDLTAITQIKDLWPADLSIAYHNRGWVYSKLKQYDKAIADFTGAIRLAPDNQDAYLDRAAAYTALGDSANAERDRKKAAEIAKQPEG